MWLVAIISQVIARIWLIAIILQVIAIMWLLAIISQSYGNNMNYSNNLASYCNNVLWQWSHILLEKRLNIHHRLPGAAHSDPCITNLTFCNNLASYCNKVTSCNNLASSCNTMTCCNNLASHCNTVLWQWSHILLEKRF